MKKSGGLSLAGTATNIIFCCDKKFCHVFSRQNTSFVATKVCLPRQNFCCDKIISVATNTTELFVETNICRDKHDKIMFVETNICRDKHSFVVTKDVFCVCRDKHVFVATKLLSREKLYLWQLPPMIVGCLVKMETGEDREKLEG